MPYYQANGAMAAAKRMGSNPRELAERIVAGLDLEGVVERAEVAGPGFINLHLANGFLEQRLAVAAADARLGIAAAEHPQTVVVDYSAPNLAKEMHVGHLRSTIIGDAVVRALEFRGDRVIRQNHVGDWGTQFGMLIANLEDSAGIAGDAALADIEDFYRAAKQRFDADATFAERARDYVVPLQGGDAHCLKLWRQFIEISAAHSEEIYRKLNVTLRHADLKGESCYNDDLPVVIEELRHKGLLSESEGARVVFLEELRDREGNPQAALFGQPLDRSYPFAAIHAQVAQAASAAGARVVDLYPANEGLHFDLLVVDGAADEHPNEIAHRIAAGVLRRVLDDVVPAPAAASSEATGTPGHRDRKD